jgi:hypothetical protein
MSRWIDRAALRLAGGAAPTALPEPPGTGNHHLTRRDAVKLAGGSALSLAALATLGPRATSAIADDYCFSACVADAENQLQSGLDVVRANFLNPGFTLSIGALGALVTTPLAAVSLQYSHFYYDRSACHKPHCDNPSKYPEPGTNPGGPTGVGVPAPWPKGGGPPSCSTCAYTCCWCSPALTNQCCIYDDCRCCPT